MARRDDMELESLAPLAEAEGLASEGEASPERGARLAQRRAGLIALTGFGLLAVAGLASFAASGADGSGGTVGVQPSAGVTSDAGAQVVSDGIVQLSSKSTGGSCIDGTPATPIPEGLNQNNIQDHPDELQYLYDISWEPSEWLTNLLEEHNSAFDQYTFRACWRRDHDKEKRAFPWVYANTKDWVWELTGNGSVVMNPQDPKDTWGVAYHQIMPDALDYFARMGEVKGRKIIPRFMLYGWSKGGTWNWPLGRWRSDLVQGSVMVSGCESPKQFDDTVQKKAKVEGAAAELWFSSPLDHYVKCTYSDSVTRSSKAAKKADLQLFQEFTCGHHPDNCWPSPKCDLNATWVAPFWDFVHKAYVDTSICSKQTTASKCNDYLCAWDSDLKLCSDAHPYKMTPSCKKFCDKSKVDTCDGLAEGECKGSYVELDVEEANANGMHSACEFADGKCQASIESFQCFFQDQC